MKQIESGIYVLYYLYISYQKQVVHPPQKKGEIRSQRRYVSGPHRYINLDSQLKPTTPHATKETK